MKVIEMMADLILGSCGLGKHDCSGLAQALLDLRYPCECCGNLNSRHRWELEQMDGHPCPTCKGTGLSPNKVLAVLAENQELPKLTGVEGDATIPEKFGFVEGVKATLKLMTAPKGGYVWKKVRE